MWAWQFMEYNMTARLHGWTEFISMQNFYAASYRNEEQEMLPLCKKHGVGVIPWSPLAGGLLTRPPKDFGETSRGKQKISQAQQCDTDVSSNVPARQ
jgi:aryl-alcohol dehydrogenase-like predicted oxidoreductase